MNIWIVWTATGQTPQVFTSEQQANRVRAQMQRNNGHLPKLKELSLPSTIIWGRGDAYLDTGVAEDLAAYIKGASLHVLDAGHWPQLDLPEEVGRYLLIDL